MATYSSKQSPSRRKAQSPENFLEALRNLGKGAVSEVKTQAKKMASVDIPESFGLSPSGTLGPSESLSVDQLQQAEQRGYSQAESQFSHRLSQMHEAERARLIREETAAKQQVQTIQQEI